MHLLLWLRERDRGWGALRRAGRTAVVMPATFALGEKVIGNATIATFAAFGSFALLLLVDFSGPMRDRLQAQVALSVVGALLVCGGTLASRAPWLAAVAMAAVGFGLIFAGVVSSVLAGATTSLLLAFILPVSLKAPVSSIPERVAGWAMASVAALIAVALLWPTPAQDPLRAQASQACRALAARLRAEIRQLSDDGSGLDGVDPDAADAQADIAVGTLHKIFLATPYRPTGLSTPARTVVRLVDELNWLNAVVINSAAPHAHGVEVNGAVSEVKWAAASVLECGADLLAVRGGQPDALEAALAGLRQALATMEQNATTELPIQRVPDGSDGPATDERFREIVTALDPSFRAQELSFVVSQIARNIALTSAAERRTWLDRVLGRQPAGLVSTLSAAQQRAAAHAERHSVWLHNSVRGAVGLGAAVFVANLSGLQHSFWVVLGTLSVLRSNALNTGESVVRGLLGTASGFIVGAAMIAAIGTNTALLWFLLPVAILFAGIAPAVISFAVGQAAFTVTLVILFNIIAPAGWRVGLLRVEDVAIGCAVSLVVGLLFWPRGAAAALGNALAEGYVESARFLTAAVEFGLLRCDDQAPGLANSPAPSDQSVQAAAASRRLDDTFRSYLAERGPKPVPLSAITGLVTGVASLRLAADAIVDLWQRDDGQAAGDRAAARKELQSTSRLVQSWYDDLAASLTGRAETPDPLDRDIEADRRLIDAVRRDLRSVDSQANATAVRVIWTGDHLDAIRRLQAALVEPARAATERGAHYRRRGRRLPATGLSTSASG
ncbi:MAG: hypothetical protein QOE71_1006 [Pseudonocardiales bacterium]|nr:hypothetical protein [Pseudonocardiales bacterium]